MPQTVFDPPPPSSSFDPTEVPGARVLMASEHAIVWEHEVPADQLCLPRMRQHTVSVCWQRPAAPCGSRLASTPPTGTDEWGLLIVPAGEPCQLRTPTVLTQWSISLSPVMLQRAQQCVASCVAVKPGRHLPRLRAGAGIHDPVLRSLVLAVHHGMRAPTPSRRHFVDSMAQALSAHLVEQHCHVASHSPEQLGDDDMSRLNAFLDSQFSERCRVDDAANLLGMPPMRFARLLKARTGQPFARYCMQRRLEQSFDLLRLGHMSVTEAAMETCFSSLAHFSRVFHRHFGVPPSSLKR